MEGVVWLCAVGYDNGDIFGKLIGGLSVGEG